MKRFKTNEAITLISLIITIIILLILAGITINMVLGENGLFNKAKTSVAKYENEQEKENTTFAGYEEEIDNYMIGKTYNIIFNKNADDAIGTMDNQTFIYGTAQNLMENGFTRQGYEFIGWNTDSTATEAIYEEKETVNNLVKINGGTLELYAIWKISYTVSFSANGGTGQIATYKTETQGEQYTIPTNEFTAPSGKEFFGWADTSDNNHFYLPNETITLNKSLSLCPLWVPSGCLKTTTGEFAHIKNRGFYKTNNGLGLCALVYYTYSGGNALSPYIFGINSDATNQYFYENGSSYYNYTVKSTFEYAGRTWYGTVGAGFGTDDPRYYNAITGIAAVYRKL